jgi:hypothetical protein
MGYFKKLEGEQQKNAHRSQVGSDCFYFCILLIF